MSLTEIRSEYLAAKSLFSEKAKVRLAEAFTEFLNKHESVQALGFLAYTPAYSDGDQTVYSVHDLHVKLNEAEEKQCRSCHAKLTADIKFCSECGTKVRTSRSFYDEFKGSYELKGESQLAEDLKELSRELTSLDEIVKDIFDDHAKITFTKEDGFVVEEWEHE